MQAMDNPETGQQYKSPGDAKFRSAVRLQPNDQAHDEEGQAIKEEYDDDIMDEKLGNRVHLIRKNESQTLLSPWPAARSDLHNKAHMDNVWSVLGFFS